MIIAISSPTGKPDQEFSARFGRCEYFAVYDLNTGEWEIIANPALDAQGGSGTQVVQFLADRGVNSVISGRYGPQAYEALTAADIKAYLATTGSPQDLLKKYQDNRLSLAAGPSGKGFHRRGRGQI